jgi:hypothetical protein
MPKVRGIGGVPPAFILSFPTKQTFMLNVKAVRPERVTLLASAFLLVGFNLTLWQHLFAITDSDGKGMLLRGAFALSISFSRCWHSSAY